MADIPFDHVLARLVKFRKWVDRVVITGGEPTLHIGLARIIETLKKRGFKVKLDTNGSRPDVIKCLVNADMIDYIAMDVKGPLEGYERWCGVAVDTDKIRESIDFILEGHVEYEFRMTLVPFLHHDRDAYEVAEFIKPARRFFLQEFVPHDTLNPRYADIQVFPPEKVRLIKERVETILSNAPIRRPLYQ